MQWIKEHIEELIALIVVVVLVVSNTGDFIVGYNSNTLSYWDVTSLVATLLFVAYITFIVKNPK